MNDISKIQSDSNNVDETLEEISFHEYAVNNVSDIFREVMGRELFESLCLHSKHGMVDAYIYPIPAIQIVFPNKLLFREVLRPYGAEIYHRLKHGDIKWSQIDFVSREGKEKVLYIGQSKKIIWLMKAIEQIIGKIAYEEWFENPRIGRVFASIDDENILTITTNNVFLKDYIINQFVYRIKKAISKDHLTDIIVVSRKKPLCNYNYPLLIDSLRKEA